MCSLVNAKSGGCAEDCGFCAQSRYAEADTPMHAMMEPEQILEHAKAAEAAGAHRFCMVTQGQGLSKTRLREDPRGRQAGRRADQPQALRLDRPHVGRARQGAARRRASSASTTTSRPRSSYYPEVSTTVRYEGRLRTIEAVKEAGLETCVGGILNLGESPRQRVEMAFELSEIDPTSVPINLLNPRSGTKFGDRELMDPWEVVKWVAIFRLIIPGALFRLCGGRVENLGELQPLAVKAGLNGVMMGNFLTTLGAEPADDRAMFEELGLNVARQRRQRRQPAPRQPLRLARGRDAADADRRADRQPGRGELLGPLDPAAGDQEEGQAARPTRSERRRLGRLSRRATSRRLEELASGAAPAAAPGRRARRARGCCSTGARCCCSARTTTSASPTTRGCARAAAEAAMRWGAGAGASRLISGNMSAPRAARGAARRRSRAPRRRCCSAPATSPTPARSPRSRGEGEVVFSDELNHASIIDGCRLARAETFVYRHADLEHLAWGLRKAGDRASLIVTDGVFSMDGDIAPLPELLELAREHGCPADGRRGPRDRRARPRRARLGRRRRPQRRGRRRRRHARQGARRLRRLRLRLRRS